MINPYAHSANPLNHHHQGSPGTISHHSSSRSNTMDAAATVHERNSSGGGSQSLVGSTRVSSHHQQYRCLYTKHKTQKRKVWQDGRLVVTDAGRRAKLFAAQPRAGSTDPVLDECEITGSSSLEQQQQQQLETEQFYIQIEGPWMDEPTTTTTTATSLPSLTIRTLTPPSKGMQKVLGCKFQKPNRYIPPPPHQRPPPKVQVVLGHRKRPLQPGEWERLHDSRRTNTSTPTSNNSNGGGGGGFKMMEQHYQQALPNTVDRQSMDPPPSHSTSHGFRDGSRGDPRQRPGTRTGGVPWELRHNSDMTTPQQQPPVHYSNESGPMAFRLGEEDHQIPLVPLPTENASRQSHDDFNGFTGVPPANNRTMGQHGVHPLPSHVQPVQSRRLGSMRFVNNEFTENRYYGLEEEEEDNEEDGGEWLGVPPTDPSYGSTTVEQHEPFRFSLVGQNTLGESDDKVVLPNPTTGDDPFPGVMNVPRALPRPSAEAPRPTRTTHELMALFGAAPAVVLEDKENTQNAPATAVATSTPAKLLGEDSSLMQFRLPSPNSNASSSDVED